jgi:hypothetical protein
MDMFTSFISAVKEEQPFDDLEHSLDDVITDKTIHKNDVDVIQELVDDIWHKNKSISKKTEVKYDKREQEVHNGINIDMESDVDNDGIPDYRDDDDDNDGIPDHLDVDTEVLPIALRLVIGAQSGADYDENRSLHAEDTEEEKSFVFSDMFAKAFHSLAGSIVDGSNAKDDTHASIASTEENANVEVDAFSHLFTSFKKSIFVDDNDTGDHHEGKEDEEKEEEQSPELEENIDLWEALKTGIFHDGVNPESKVHESHTENVVVDGSSKNVVVEEESSSMTVKHFGEIFVAQMLESDNVQENAHDRGR